MNVKRSLAIFLSAAILAGNSVVTDMSVVHAEVQQVRQMERLDRGLVAMKTNDGIYLSWRLMSDEDMRFGTATKNVAFNIYRDNTLIATEQSTTNFIDTSGTASSKYSVAPVVDGVEGEKSKQVSAFSSNSNYFDIPLSVPANFTTEDGNTYSYFPGDTSCGDLDGDGEYELVVKWDCNPQDNSNGGYTGNVLLDAYKLDGTRLWRIDLGRNIRSGAHYTQFLVYDFDLDGKAEVTCKTAPGSKDGKGNYVTAASSDSSIKSADNTAVYITDGGYVFNGPEYFTIFDGETGEALDTINYPTQRVSTTTWGDNYGNRSERYLADVAWLDGQKPYAVYWRGYYFPQQGYSGRTGIAGISFDGERLNVEYLFDTLNTQPGYSNGNENYIGQGNHNITVADVDGDGKDEVISGALCLEVNEENKLVVKWCSWREHGDALHIGDYDPTHEGYEYFSVHEDGATDGSIVSHGKVLDFGMTVYDAATGEELKHVGNTKDTGRGVMANVGAGGYYQFWGAGTYKAMGNGVFEPITINGLSSNFRIFWDGDLYDELLDGTTITSWDGNRMSPIFSATGCTQINGTKANPALQADLFGDWREEVVYPTTDGKKLRVFTTNIYTEFKIKTLMHDSVYRSGVAAEQTAYNQPPHIGFYLDEEIFKGRMQGIRIASLPDKTTYYVGEELDLTGLVVEVMYGDGSSREISGCEVSGYNKNASGKQTLQVNYRGATTTFDVTVVSGFKINEQGLITGYDNISQTEVIVPDIIDGIQVTGFADSAMLNTNVSKLYIYSEELTFSGTVFDQNITIVCYEGSTAHEYAKANNVSYELIKTDKDAEVVTFEENFYSSYVGKAMLSQSTSSEQTLADQYVTYNAIKADSRFVQFTGLSSFEVVKANNNTYLKANTSISFGDSYNISISVNNPPVLEKVSEARFSMDICFPSGTGTTNIVITDGTNTIERVNQAGLGLANNKWYTYELVYSDGKYTRTVYNSDGSVFRTAEVLSVKPGTNGVARINFSQEWVWGQNATIAYVYLDNLVMDSDIASEVQFKVTDVHGKAIEGAKITMAEKTVYTNAAGIAYIKVAMGKYTAAISADRYETIQQIVSAREESKNVSVVMNRANYDITGVEIDRNDINLRVGDYEVLNHTVFPVHADQTVTWSSSNEDVAVVDQRGVIYAKAEGNAVITATAGAYSASCNVSVITADYEQAVTSIKIYGEETAEGNRWIGTELPIQRAEIYDQKGVRMQNHPNITWSCSNANTKLLADHDAAVITVSAGYTGTVTLKASCGNVSASKSIQVIIPDDNYVSYVNITFDENEYKDFTLTQNTTVVSQSKTGVTYYVNPRSGGSDWTTGFKTAKASGNTYLVAVAGKFNTSNRNAYFVIDNAPVLSNNQDYVFKADMYFYQSSQEITLSIGDDTSTITSFSPTTKGLASNTWYQYMLIYSDGVFYEYITKDGMLAAQPVTYTSNAKKISKLNFTGPGGIDGVSASMGLDNMSLAAVDRVFATALVNVSDRDGNNIYGAVIQNRGTDITGKVATNENGNASIMVFYGGNSLLIGTDKGYVVKHICITEDNQWVYAVADSPKMDIVSSNDTRTVLMSDYSNDVFDTGYLYCAYYKDNGSLIGVQKVDAAICRNKTLLVIPHNAKGAAKVKVMLWSDENHMVPKMKATESETDR